MENFNAKQLEAIKKYIASSEELRNSYFFDPPAEAGSRCRYERKKTFEYVDERLKLRVDVSCSCKNVYVSRTCVVDGYNRNARFLKNVIAREGALLKDSGSYKFDSPFPGSHDD